VVETFSGLFRSVGCSRRQSPHSPQVIAERANPIDGQSRPGSRTEVNSDPSSKVRGLLDTWIIILRLRSFPKIAYPMATHVRRFVTSPQPIFESEFPFGTQTPLPLIAAAKCLVLCIEVSEGGIGIKTIASLILRVHVSASTRR